MLVETVHFTAEDLKLIAEFSKTVWRAVKSRQVIRIVLPKVRIVDRVFGGLALYL